uniref:Uncharacterized protein n=1 Tax=Pararge aegeria TaxID=116150 RepID=S4PK65_9NEOP
MLFPFQTSHVTCGYLGAAGIGIFFVLPLKTCPLAKVCSTHIRKRRCYKWGFSILSLLFGDYFHPQSHGQRVNKTVGWDLNDFLSSMEKISCLC